MTEIQVSSGEAIAATSNNSSENQFKTLGIIQPIVQALDALGFKTPTDIQRESIGPLLQGRHLIAQAKTGTGKTAAFGLPMLCQINPELFAPQALILAPTRELAIQVAEALQSYATHLKGLKVLPIYGGQDYRTQLRGLKNGAQIIVGTPGRVIDHLDRKTLDLSQVNMVVLDEADEMLNMGFIDDVEKILQASRPEAQRALFSATMPPQIKKMAAKYLQDPCHISIKASEKTASSIEQFYCVVYREHKFEALTRFLATEHGTATIIFAKTKNDTTEIAQKLEAHDYRVAAINGDLNQAAREQVIARLKSGILDVVVATDVAARGLDVERLDYVINYDIPFDVESYVHRIGRTGRAGRVGRALILVNPKELRTLRDFQRITGYEMKEMFPPSKEQVQAVAQKAFCAELAKIHATLNILPLESRLQAIEKALGCDTHTLAAILLCQLESTQTKHFSEMDITQSSRREDDSRGDRNSRRDRSDRSDNRNDRGDRSDFGDRRRQADSRFEPKDFEPRNSGGRRSNADRAPSEREPGMTRCEMNMGRDDGVTPADIVGLIINRCQLSKRMIGRIDISQKLSHIDLAEEVAGEVIHQLANAKFKRRSISLKAF